MKYMSGDLWTTVGVPDLQIERFWRECVHHALLELDINVDVARGFAGTVRSRSIGRLQVNHVSVDGTQILRRTPAIIARCGRPRFVLIRMRAGQGCLRHRGGEVPLRADECVLLDSREPYELTVSGRSESLSFHLPIDWVEAHLPDPQVAVAVPLGSRQPWAGILCDAMETIHADFETLPPFVVAQNLCTALALTVDATEIRSTRHSRKIFMSLQQTLAGMAATCNVTAREIAQAHGISLRYLHAIYSANGTSCGRELIRLRLERAQRLLLDPREPNRLIEDIAWQCGFSDASHFRRRFRALFGVSPSAMRMNSSRIAHSDE
jgi:AraC-like DNA-binding protein